MEFYFGKNLWKELKDEFEKASEIIVVSPFISKHFAEYLMNKHKAGKKVLLITSDEKIGFHKEALNKLQKRKILYIRFFALSFLTALFFLLALVNLFSLIFALIFVFLLLKFGFKKEFIIPTIIFGKDNFIHAKIYIIDRRIVIASSANFTYKGLNENYEFFTKMDDEKIVENLIKKLEKILKIKI